ncbi:hypothetical protein TUMEXPCC7403_07060 [Tumidithrix helvetica PCC 7403]|uniref:eCIS core domain-containing protein n=1 Tax=Tumidithrix helvetica TaxID=3457545 RepID=UPI003CAE204A
MRKYIKKPPTDSSFAPPTIQMQTRPFAPPQAKERTADGNSKEQLANLNSAQDLYIPADKFIVHPERMSNESLMQRKWEGIVQRYKEKQAAESAAAQPIQAKLAIGAVGDKYEQEADSVAAQVVQKINVPESAQRKAMPEEEEELQMKPEISSLQREAMPEEEEELQMQPLSGTIQREAMPEEEEELQMKSVVQRRDTLAGGEASENLESSIQSARGSGQSLDPNLQAKMGEAMGADFSGVKVHTDSQSDQLNKSIQAKAFTTGQDVFFRQGEYEPNSRGGQELIAHELTHVVQQGRAGKRLPFENEQEGSCIEAFSEPIQAKKTETPNQTGLPNDLKSGVENLSGYSLNDVRVHYNSPKPVQLQALAYTQGTEIHVAPGQEEYLPHEAWHVVQQMQGRVKPTMQMKGVRINDDVGLEREADLMGMKAEHGKDETIGLASSVNRFSSQDLKHGQGLVQRVIYKLIKKNWTPIKEKDKVGEHELPEPTNERINHFFNNVNGKISANLEDVEGEKLAYEEDCDPLFYTLYKIIKEDDKKDPSQIDIRVKQEVIKYRKNQEKLYDLAYIIHYEGAKAKTPETLINDRSPKFKHGEIEHFDIDDSINEKRLKTQKDLTSDSPESREGAVKTIRGTDKIYTSYQGAIYRPFIEEERKAILGLVEAVKGAQVMFSLERGGSLIADLIEKLGGIESPKNIKIPKLEKETEAKDYLGHILKDRPMEQERYTGKESKIDFEGIQKKAQQERFKELVVDFVEKNKGKEEITIAIAETAVGGGSVNIMRQLVADICEKVKDSKTKVTFRILVARETIKHHGRRGKGIVKLTDNVEKAIKEGQVLTTDNPHQVEMYISELSYLIGEDVDYQTQYVGGMTSKKPVIVFEGEDDITAMSITPASEGEDTAREVIMDLVAGAYDQLMAELFDSK